MLRESSRQDSSLSDIGDFEPDVEALRSILAGSRKLPPAVVESRFARICDRVLDEKITAALTDPDQCPQEDANKRCERRKKALTPYLGKRLVCVLINLPGVMYTIEIEPTSERVIHWEWVAV